MFTCNLDPKSKVPLYQQLYEYIQNSINNGELKAEEKLPSKRKLSQHLKISVITIENAYEQLITEGYIYSKPQKGFYVTDIYNKAERCASVMMLRRPGSVATINIYELNIEKISSSNYKSTLPLN